MRKLLPVLLISALFLVFCETCLAQAPAQLYDIVLAQGTIHRGDGSEPFTGHVAIKGERIAAVTTGDVPDAAWVVNCAGLVVCPGFIDLHNHSDYPVTRRDTRNASNYLMQGCTTLVTGNCGTGHADVAKYFAGLDENGVGANIAHLLPQGSLRIQVMGYANREPTPEELEKMRSLADKAMKDGAFGMSTGLIYVPGTFTKTEELIEIAKTVSRHGGLYASHMRGEGDTLLESIREVLRIGREADLRVHVSHLKSSGKANWGRMRLALELIEQARADGARVTADQYPYTAASTTLNASVFPRWATEGGRAGLQKKLEDPGTAARIRDAVAKSIAGRSRLQLATCNYRPRWIGRSITEIAEEEGRDPADIAIEIEVNGGASMINFGLSEDDVRLAMPVGWIATGSDGDARVPTAAQPHPRSFGTFPRKIGRYAIEYEVLPLAAAIRSATGLPAEILGLTDRGQLAADRFADITVFDPRTFRDQATYEEPFLPPTGTRYVLVNGKFAVFAGHVTGILAGKAIRRPHVGTALVE